MSPRLPENIFTRRYFSIQNAQKLSYRQLCKIFQDVVKTESRGSAIVTLDSYEVSNIRPVDFFWQSLRCREEYLAKHLVAQDSVALAELQDGYMMA